MTDSDERKSKNTHRIKKIKYTQDGRIRTSWGGTDGCPENRNSQQIVARN